jgi:predicted nuclease of predicted toxin-antitoxin system
VRFLVDAQLPPALARLLTQHGHVAEHVHDIGLGHAPDRDIWRIAGERGAVLITKDEDSADLVVLGAADVAVVWIRTGNTTRRALVDWFEPLVDRIVATIEDGEKLIELR